MLYFSWHKVLTLSLKNQKFLNFNCVLLIIKFVEGFRISLFWPYGIDLPMQLPFLVETFITVSWYLINHFAVWKHFYLIICCLSCYIMQKTHGLGLDVQRIKPARSICIQSFVLLRGIIRDLKQTLTHCSTSLKSTSWRWVENSKNYRQHIKR